MCTKIGGLWYDCEELKVWRKIKLKEVKEDDKN